MSGSRRTRDQEGTAAVEFAIVLPLLLLVFGIVQYALYYRSTLVGAAAARDAARYAAVGTPLSCQDFRSVVAARLDAVQTGDVVVSRDYSGPVSPVAQGDDVTVVVAFNSADMNFPFLPFVDDGRVTQRYTARVEDVPDLTLADCS